MTPVATYRTRRGRLGIIVQHDAAGIAYSLRWPYARTVTSREHLGANWMRLNDAWEYDVTATVRLFVTAEWILGLGTPDQTSTHTWVRLPMGVKP